MRCPATSADRKEANKRAALGVGYENENGSRGEEGSGKHQPVYTENANKVAQIKENRVRNLGNLELGMLGR